MLTLAVLTPPDGGALAPWRRRLLLWFVSQSFDSAGDERQREIENAQGLGVAERATPALEQTVARDAESSCHRGCDEGGSDVIETDVKISGDRCREDAFQRRRARPLSAAPRSPR